MLLKYGLVVLLLGLAMFFSVKTGRLNIAGAITGGLIGLLIFTGAGYTGLALLGTFFILGSAATSWKMSVKQKLGVAEKNKGRRKAGQVIANGGVAAILGLMAACFPEKAGLFCLMMAAGLSSATADTLSSELGMVYGKRFYNILTFQKDERGLDGVVSREGTLFGLAGSCIISFIYATGFGWNENVLWIILSGTAGNFFDSLLGATLERRHQLSNDAVNFFNTLLAALSGGLLMQFL
jgi:uncharacterized protein (TIGR00297 family)